MKCAVLCNMSALQQLKIINYSNILVKNICSFFFGYVNNVDRGIYFFTAIDEDDTQTPFIISVKIKPLKSRVLITKLIIFFID